MNLQDTYQKAWKEGDFELKPEVRYISYQVKIPMEQWAALINAEIDGSGQFDPLYEVLESETKAFDVDYDGFCANWVFFNLDAIETDQESELKNILQVIEKHLNFCLTFKPE